MATEPTRDRQQGSNPSGMGAENMGETGHAVSSGSAQQSAGLQSGGQQSGGTQQGSAQQGRAQQGSVRYGGQQESRQASSGTQMGTLLRPNSALSLWNRNPFAVMQRMTEEMDRLFGSFLRSSPFAPGRERAAGPALWSPQIDVMEQNNELVVCIDLPGVRKEDVRVEVSDGMLNIEGQRSEETQSERQGYRRTERSYGAFSRAIPLPEGIDAGNAKATMKDGVLRIAFTTPPRQQGRQLEIQ
jgi:HSP20 family protein